MREVFIYILLTLTLAACSNNQSADTEFNSFTARVNVNIADIKKKPEKFSERVTQALYNEIVTVLDTTRRYSKIELQDRYVGWIRNWYLDKDTTLTGEDTYVVDVFLAPAFQTPDKNGIRHAMFPYGCSLYGNKQNDYLKIQSSRYGVIYVSLNDLITEDSYIYNDKPDSTLVSMEAGKFIGSPYLWGGKSFYGIDCSGLTQLVLKKFGVDLYRDSKDQRTQGIEIQRSEIKAGDLLFFPKHVGLAVTNDLMIHSTGGNGGVAYNSLNPQSPIYSKYHDEKLETVRRVIR